MGEDREALRGVVFTVEWDPGDSHDVIGIVPSGKLIKLWNMAIEIVSFPIAWNYITC